MSGVYFVRTAYHYVPYDDLFTLAELSGYPVIALNEIDPQSDNTYIVTPLNGEWENGWLGARARIIHWELEWRVDERSAQPEPPGVSEVWHMDARAADRIGARYVPVGSHPGLNLLNGSHGSVEKTFDVIHLAYQNYRRQTITNALKDAGLELAPCHDLWGMKRSIALAASRVMVHSHQWDNQAGVPGLRFAVAAAHRIPVISESVSTRGMFGYTYLPTADFEYLPTFVIHMLKDERLLADYAGALNNLLCERKTFRRIVEEAL